MAGGGGGGGNGWGGGWRIVGLWMDDGQLLLVVVLEGGVSV